MPAVSKRRVRANKETGFLSGPVAYAIVGLVFLYLLSVGMSRMYPEGGPEAARAFFLFLVFFVLIIGFFVAANWAMAAVLGDGDGKNAPVSAKFFLRHSFARDALVTAALFAPLYFPFLILRTDLAIGFKAVLFVLSVSAYLLVQLSFVFEKAVTLSVKISDFLNRLQALNPERARRESYGLIALVIPLFFVLFIGGVLYAGYRLTVFYIEAFK